MVIQPQDVPHGPELEVTEARQARQAPGMFLTLAASTVLALLAVAIVWAFFAGPLHHTSTRQQVSSPAEAAGFQQPPPSAKLRPNPNTTGTSASGPINSK
jgi:hypothetical protein